MRYVVKTPLKTADDIVPAGGTVELDDAAADELAAVRAIEPEPSDARRPGPFDAWANGDGTFDAVAMLSDLSGVPRDEVQTIFDQVKAGRARNTPEGEGGGGPTAAGAAASAVAPPTGMNEMPQERAGAGSSVADAGVAPAINAHAEGPEARTDNADLAKAGPAADATGASGSQPEAREPEAGASGTSSSGPVARKPGRKAAKSEG